MNAEPPSGEQGDISCNLTVTSNDPYIYMVSIVMFLSFRILLSWFFVFLGESS